MSRLLLMRISRDQHIVVLLAPCSSNWSHLPLQNGYTVYHSREALHREPFLTYQVCVSMHTYCHPTLAQLDLLSKFMYDQGQGGPSLVAKHCQHCKYSFGETC
jgi:hypothetical protein